MKWARACEIVVGAVFLAAALGKALDVPAFGFVIRAYGIAQDSLAVALWAYGVIAVEGLLGALLVAGIRMNGALPIAAMGLLGVMTLLLAAGWMRQEPLPCGCFGVFGEMGRPAAIAKNIVFIGMLAYAWRMRLPLAQGAPSPWRKAAHVAAVAAGISIVVAALVTDKPVVQGELKNTAAEAAGRKAE